MIFSRLQHALIILGCLALSWTLRAETTLVAVAANFSEPMAKIAERFEQATGHVAKLSFGSSGKFVAQIENGAPFEVFLSADQKNPLKLEESGLSVPDSRFTYAIGKLVLWSATVDFVDAKGEVLSKGAFKHLALADPKLAPYGVAAIETLSHLGLQEKLKPLFVQGENISQTHQFVESGNAELGFLALSQVIDPGTGQITAGSGWIVPEDHYSPLLQDAVLLQRGVENPATPALLEFLKSKQASDVIRQYGYRLATQP